MSRKKDWVAKDLRSPKYRQRVEEDRKKFKRSRLKQTDRNEALRRPFFTRNFISLISLNS